MSVEKISAVTLKVTSMQASVQFYRDLHLEKGGAMTQWGQLIFYVPQVDAFWGFLKKKGLQPGIPQDASWGERYFHMYDPDSHELSFAYPLR